MENELGDNRFNSNESHNHKRETGADNAARSSLDRGLDDRP